MRVDLPSNVTNMERRAVLATLEEYAARENARPNPWMLAGRATVTRIGALQIRHMARNPEAYVKGAVRHVDHKTVVLQVWHRVVMNTEGQSQAMRHVVFLD